MATIADILMARARQAGESRRQQADVSGGMWRDLGGIIAQTGGAILRERQEAPMRAQDQRMRELQIREAEAAEQGAIQGARETEGLKALFARGPLPTLEETAQWVGPERAIKILEGAKALAALPGETFDRTQERLRKVLLGMDNLPEAARAEYYQPVREHLIQRGVIKPEDAPEAYQPEWWAMTRQYGQEPAKEPAPQGFTLSPGQQRFGPTGESIASVPADERQPDTRSLQQQANDALRSGDTAGYARIMKVIRETAAAGREPQGTTPRAPIWVVKDGQFVDLAGVAPQGSTPANIREQGRPVTSGDAGRVAELDTSLDDLVALGSTLTETKRATGTMAAIGASMWNPITELTGWGTTAKQRQGVIDRVKQVIGKALEGGVLRKEDEIKYTKILPTISDPHDVAVSKLEGLRAALVQRRQTLLEALADAGYDIGKFAARPERAGRVYYDADGNPVKR